MSGGGRFCQVCEMPILPNDTPVYTDEGVYHIDCEAGIFEEVFAQI